MMDALEFYIGELESALNTIGLNPVQRAHEIEVAARNVITAWDAENDPNVERDGYAPRCPDCLDHPGWAHGDVLRRREPDDVCRSCHGSGVDQSES